MFFLGLYMSCVCLCQSSDTGRVGRLGTKEGFTIYSDTHKGEKPSKSKREKETHTQRREVFQIKEGERNTHTKERSLPNQRGRKKHTHKGEKPSKSKREKETHTKERSLPNQRGRKKHTRTKEGSLSNQKREEEKPLFRKVQIRIL